MTAPARAVVRAPSDATHEGHGTHGTGGHATSGTPDLREDGTSVPQAAPTVTTTGISVLTVMTTVTSDPTVIMTGISVPTEMTSARSHALIVTTAVTGVPTVTTTAGGHAPT